MYKTNRYSRIPDSNNDTWLFYYCFAKEEQDLKGNKEQLLKLIGKILVNKTKLVSG